MAPVGQAAVAVADWQGGAANAVGSNHGLPPFEVVLIPCRMLAGPTWMGVLVPPEARFKYVELYVTVKGVPVMTVRMPSICHPPTILSSPREPFRKCFPLPKGSW